MNKMSKSLLFVTLLIAGYYKGSAQTIGGGLIFGTKISEPGIGLNGQYFLTKEWALAPSLLFYFANKSNYYYNPGYYYEGKTSVWEFNADANYYFYDKEVKLYGVGGINFTSIKTTNTNITKNGVYPNSSASVTKAGINLGIGIDFKTKGKIIPFFLTKYTASDYDQLVLFGGIRYQLGK